MKFYNVLNEQSFIHEMHSTETGRDYLIRTSICKANKGFLKGMMCSETYITDNDPTHGVLVHFCSKAFSLGEFEEEMEMGFPEIGRLIREGFPGAVERFENILAHGIAGNELII